jgi:glycosyltransferase involved in cell wall biosynthesis
VKLAVVVPRYGRDVIGGAETGARELAEHLADLLGWEVDVLTTTALEATTWDEHYSPGTAVEGGVRVHRFPVDRGRHPDFAARSNAYFASPAAHTPAEQAAWVAEQGPVSSTLLDAVRSSDADRLVFYPYLYDPTVRGLPTVAERAVLHAAAHDEAPIHIPLVADVFRRAPTLVHHSDAEQRLVARLFPETIARPQIVLGLGVAAGRADRGSADALLGPVADRPFLLCLGRVDPGKGVDALVGYFDAYKRRRPGPLALVVAGPIGTAPPPHPDVVVTGPVSEGAKWDLLERATALVSPSPHESFSLVVLEAWLAGTPVLANAWCEPTSDHCRASGGGVAFGDLAEFSAAVDVLTTRPQVAAAMARAGAAYVEDRYAWPTLVRRYERFLADVAPT